jgi:hypothetical protein
MSRFEESLVSELAGLLRAGAGMQAVRITVHEETVAYLVRGPSGPEEASGAVEACLRAARRMIREYGAREDLMEAILMSALDAVRGHGGRTALSVREAARTAYLLLEEFEREREIGFGWRVFLERY